MARKVRTLKPILGMIKKKTESSRGVTVYKIEWADGLEEQYPYTNHDIELMKQLFLDEYQREQS